MITFLNILCWLVIAFFAIKILFWLFVAFCFIYWSIFGCKKPATPSSVPDPLCDYIQRKLEAKPLKSSGKDRPSIFGSKKKKPAFGSWAWVVQQQKKEDAHQRKLAQQAAANRIAQEQMRRMINGGGY